MWILIVGLVLFIGTHSLRVYADGWRLRMINRLGRAAWKGVYGLASIAGFVLIIWGFALARHQPTQLYAPPDWLRHLNALFTLAAFVLIAAAYVPRNRLKSMLGHPMLAGVKLWAFGHLLASGMLRDVVLFGSFLAWAIVVFAVSRRRDRVTGVSYPPGTLVGDVITVLAAVIAWAVFAFWLHARLIGVNPFT